MFQKFPSLEGDGAAVVADDGGRLHFGARMPRGGGGRGARPALRLRTQFNLHKDIFIIS